MNTLNGYPLHIEQREGFTVQLSFEDEFISPYDVYDIYGKEDLQDILDGKYIWCIAIITVSKSGVKLAENALGCCEYQPEFLLEAFGGYYDDMVNEAIKQAKEKLIELCK